MIKNRTGIFLLALTFLGVSSFSMAQPERFLAGRDYTVISNSVTDRTPDVVEVTELFWYGCPGCYQFEPQLEQWIANQKEDVACLRMPAVWDDWREVHARAYYTARVLNVLDEMHPVLFNAMHLQGNRLRDEQELGELFSSQGINEEEFTRAYNSFSVNSEIQRAKNLAIQYQAHSTPSMIINGKYVVTLSKDTLDIVDFLVNKERSRI